MHRRREAPQSFDGSSPRIYKVFVDSVDAICLQAAAAVAAAAGQALVGAPLLAAVEDSVNLLVLSSQLLQQAVQPLHLHVVPGA